MAEKILFNSRTRGYEWLSAFFMKAFEWNGQSVKSAEHAYHGEKTCSLELRKRVHAAETPQYAKALGRVLLKDATQKAEWRKRSWIVMLEIQRAKFRDKELADRLMATGEKELVHLSPWDLFWGVDATGRGRNVQGKIIMHVRRELVEGRRIDPVKEREDYRKARRGLAAKAVSEYLEAHLELHGFEASAECGCGSCARIVRSLSKSLERRG